MLRRYERRYIERWLAGGRNLCPSTGTVLTLPATLVPNVALRKSIEVWAEKHARWMLVRQAPILQKVIAIFWQKQLRLACSQQRDLTQLSSITDLSPSAAAAEPLMGHWLTHGMAQVLLGLWTSLRGASPVLRMHAGAGWQSEGDP